MLHLKNLKIMRYLILGFFLDAPLNSLDGVDILLDTKIISLAYIDSILALLSINGTCLCDCVILRFL